MAIGKDTKSHVLFSKVCISSTIALHQIGLDEAAWTVFGREIESGDAIKEEEEDEKWV